MQRVNPLHEPDWDRMVKALPGAGFFHSSSWARVLNGTYGHAPHYFCALDRARLEVVLPVMEVSSPIRGRRAVSLPFTDECPALSVDPARVADVFQEAVDYGRSCGWKTLECRGLQERPAKGAVPSLSFYAHVLQLRGSGEGRFDRLEGSVRRAVRKAVSSGVRVEVLQTLEAVRAFYALHCRTRRRHGLPPQPFRFFAGIFEHAISEGHGFVALARLGEKPIAAAVFLHLGNQAIFKFGASDRRYQQLRANDLVMWEAIQWYALRGYDSLHLGRTSMANAGLRRFKRGFGAEEYVLNYHQFDFTKDDFVRGRDGAYGWHNAVFRLMPIPLSRMLGALLYRYQS